jgi:histidinol dehydrogenase
VEATVRDIVDTVREEGDAALRRYTEAFDNVRCDGGVEVPASVLDAALAALSPELRRTMERAAANIRRFHERQRTNSWFDAAPDGSILGQKVTPLGRVGVYAPAGSAPLPSTVLMDVIPARVAGVGEIILCSPPDAKGSVNPLVAACARIAGADRVFAVGGAQAVAAMAYGTESIPRVDKIVGPGNIYVTMAKKQVFGVCGIDMIAGPSEVLVLADDTANPVHVAADLLSQAEHDPLASSVLVTPSAALADAVEAEVARQAALLPRAEIIMKSLNDFGAIVVTRDLDETLAVCNRVAPEHLEVLTADPMALLGRIRNAGAVFLGPWSPEPLGDYFAGPNHTLPTAGTARFFSPLSVDDFIRKTSVISYTRDAFLAAADDIVRFAEAEGLDAHAASVKVRLDANADSVKVRQDIDADSVKVRQSGGGTA